MKIIQVNTYDIQGGAARAAYRLHQGLIQIGMDCKMTVRHKASTDDSVLGIIPKKLDEKSDEKLILNKLVQDQYINAHRTDISNTIFSLPYPGYDISRLEVVRDADIINLHWVAYYQSPLTLQKLFALGKPVVWTLHDQWSFTGGCHYSAGCEKYFKDCSACPQLADDLFDLPASMLKDKLELFKGANLTIVSPSKWLGDCSRKSRLFKDVRVEVIPNSLDTNTFSPLPKSNAEGHLSRSDDIITLLFGATTWGEKRKGFRELLAAMKYCLNSVDFRALVKKGKIRLVCFGYSTSELDDIGVPIIPLGYLNTDEQIRRAYATADIFILPSLEDNFPNTILESLSCGIPVIAFDVGGIPDVITNDVTGKLVTAGDAQGMGDAILSLVFNDKLRSLMGQNCRKLMIEKYDLQIQAHHYMTLYSELLHVSKLSTEDSLVQASITGQRNSELSNASELDALSVNIETNTGQNFQQIYEKVLSKTLKEFIPYMHKQLEDSKMELESLRSSLQASEADRATKVEIINNLQQNTNTLSSFRAATKTIVIVISKKLRLYEFLKGHRDFFYTLYRSLRNFYNFITSPVKKDSPAANDLRLSINSPKIEAYIGARNLDGDVDDQTMVELYDLGVGLKNILCLNPSANNFQILYVLSRTGAKTTCLNCQRNQTNLRSYGFSIFHDNLSEWMINTGQTTLADYDCLLLDEQISENTLQLLKGRLWPKTKIFINGRLSDDHPVRSAWGSPEFSTNGVEVYDALPEDWLDPAHNDRYFYHQTFWPWKKKEVDIPSTLPSGRPWPKISIITVTLNQGGYLEETLRSVLLQGYPNLEYIVLDGGSTDTTLDILKRYQHELTHCISEKDKGQSDALNKGFRLASGDILAWLNSDDTYCAGTLWRVALAFDVYETDIIAGGCALRHGDSQSSFRIHHNSMPIGKVVPLSLERLMDIDGSWQKGYFFYQPEVFWSRAIWEKCGAHVDENLFYSMDYELWLRMAQNRAKIVHIPDTLTVFRVHKNQKTSGDDIDDIPFLTELREVKKTFKKNLKSHEYKSSPE